MNFVGTITPYQLELDFKQNKMETVIIHQYDKDSRNIIVQCTDNTVATLIDYLSITARVKWMKPDSEPVFNDCIVNQDGTITIPITEQMSITSGTANAELMLSEISSGSILHSMPFRALVTKGVFPNDTVTSSYEFDALNQALAQTDSFVAALNVHKLTPATEITMAHVKLSDSSAITTPGTYALDAVEKNASVNGTMANSISTLQSATPIINTNGTFLNITDCFGGTSWLTDWTRNWLTAMTLANLKTANPTGTWTDTNSTTSTYVVSGITVTVTHSNGNVLSINTNGLSTNVVTFYIATNLTLSNLNSMVSGCPSGGNISTYVLRLLKNGTGTTYDDSGNGVLVPQDSATYNLYIRIASGVTVPNKLFLPQIESGSTKHNFVPPSGYPVYACQKNLLQNTATTSTVSGVVMTKNTDGSITAVGTATSSVFLLVNTVMLPSGNYIVNGCPSGGTSSTYSICVEDSSGNPIAYDIGSGISVSISSGSVYKIYIYIRSGTTVNHTFKPMIRLASVTDATYEAYNGNTVNVTNDTVSPVSMLGYANMTNVFSGYGGMVRLLYPKTQVGKSLLESYNSAISGSLANQLSVHKTTLSTDTVAGHTKLSDSSAITQTGVYALDAVEKNASVSGTLANGLSLRPLIANMFYPNNQYGGIIVTNANTITTSGFYTAYGTATGVPNNGSSWFISHINSNAGTQSAYQRAVAYSTTLIVYERIRQSGTWGSWISISDSVKGMMSDIYSASATYAVGDLVINNNALYRCTTAITAEAWNAAHWTATTLDAEILAVKSNSVGYLDVSTKITSGSTTSTATYTAIRNCYIIALLTGSNGLGNSIDIDGIQVAVSTVGFTTTTTANKVMIPIKTGQVVTFHGNASYGLIYDIYAMK